MAKPPLKISYKHCEEVGRFFTIFSLERWANSLEKQRELLHLPPYKLSEL
jgi:hypothetical protein